MSSRKWSDPVRVSTEVDGIEYTGLYRVQVGGRAPWIEVFFGDFSKIAEAFQNPAGRAGVILRELILEHPPSTE